MTCIDDESVLTKIKSIQITLVGLGLGIQTS